MKTQKTLTQKFLAPLKWLGWISGAENNALLRIVPNNRGVYAPTVADFAMVAFALSRWALALYGVAKLAGVL